MNKKPFFQTWTFWIVFLLVVIVAYTWVKKIEKDRERARLANMTQFSNPYMPPAPNGMPMPSYDPRSVAAMQQRGQMPPGVMPGQPYMPPPGMPPNNDPAIQQNLRTMQDINRANQMNQKMMDEQRKSQR